MIFDITIVIVWVYFSNKIFKLRYIPRFLRHIFARLTGNRMVQTSFTRAWKTKNHVTCFIVIVAFLVEIYQHVINKVLLISELPLNNGNFLNTCQVMKKNFS